jgi:hypothetical protein
LTLQNGKLRFTLPQRRADSPVETAIKSVTIDIDVAVLTGDLPIAAFRLGVGRVVKHPMRPPTITSWRGHRRSAVPYQSRRTGPDVVRDC